SRYVREAVETDWETCSAMLRPSTLTARVSGRRRAPPQTSHGWTDMYFSSSSRRDSDCVSLYRRARIGSTPSQRRVQWYVDLVPFHRNWNSWSPEPSHRIFLNIAGNLAYGVAGLTP